MKPTGYCILGLIAVLFLAGCSSFDFWRSDDSIQACILKSTPIGSTPEEVNSLLFRNEWRTTGYEPHREFTLDGKADPKWKDTSYIEAYIGHYNVAVFTRVDILACWIFDKNQRLEEVRIFRTDTSL